MTRRAAFVEKPEEKPEIIRTGRKWQPPPEKPYVWPSVPRSASVDISPSPDGSHRPKPAFRKERVAPSGGFYPHAPNAVKVVKHRPASAQGLLAPVDGTTESVDIIQQRNFHRIDGGYRNSPNNNGEHYDRKAMRKSQPTAINDWEKIYDLPPHSSTIVGKDVPTNINVKRRLSHFQGSVQNLQRRQENARAYQENARSYSMDGVRDFIP
ncbi:unnamed protein product [Cylicostephanus goldi]|uniref:Uncharacterized protein n=1 Tax=Cylicostephanus goldi TaxID=71465 RepID=A0A3P7N017_CYLGO|nr:unnamed protein product [Cylicostephanus goldi]